MYGLVDYGAMLRDRTRIESYTRALSAAVTPRSVVLDVGAGVGTFSILAAKLGAARVYAIERAPEAIAVAEELARANGVADRIQFIQAAAAEAELPEKADVIVSDLSSALPLFEEHLPTIVSVRDRFLAPGGVLIPASARLFCAPVSSAALYESIVGAWRSVPEVDFRTVEEMVLQMPHARVVKPEDLGGEPRVWGDLDYATLVSPNVSATVEWDVHESVHGIALWFENTMFAGVHAASGPWSPGSVHATIVLPLLVPLQPGRLRLDLEATLAAGWYVTSWHARTESQAGTRQSTFLSHPRSFRVSERVLARRVGQDLLLLETSTGVYHALNETGAVVWEALQAGKRMDAVAAAVAERYDVERSEVAEDVAGIVAELHEAKLIEALP